MDNKKANAPYIRNEVWISLVLVLATLAVYLQVYQFKFIDYDTPVYVYNNNYVRAGLSLPGIKWAFTTTVFSNWHPLTWLSHMLDVELYGLNSGQHHLTNVIIHILNVLLLFFLLRSLTGKILESGLVAALFSLHPLHIESVAWIAERKDLLCSFFFFLTIYLYYRYVQNRTLYRYSLVCVSFCLGFMAKPMIISLPLVLLLLDYWPLSRVEFKKSCPTIQSCPSISLVLLEKIPLFLFSALFAAITLFAQSHTINSASHISLILRIANALTSYAGYIFKMIWPIKLAVIYPYHSISAYQIITAVLFLFLISLVVYKYYKSSPWLLFGWLWYLITALPVIGFIQVGHQSMADRYTYIPLIGIFIMISWSLSTFLQRKQNNKRNMVIISILLILLSSTITWWQLRFWKNSTTLFQRALEVTQQNYVAEHNYGYQLLLQKQYVEAIKHFKKTLELNPTYTLAYVNLGMARAQTGESQKAIACFQHVIQTSPSNYLAHYNLAIELDKIQQSELAIFHFKQAIAINPRSLEAYWSLGQIYEKQQKTKMAISLYSKIEILLPGNKIIQQKLESLKEISKL